MSNEARKIIYRYRFKGRAPMSAYGRTFRPGQECHVEPGSDFERWLKNNPAFSGPEIVVAGGDKAAEEAAHAASLDRRRRDAMEQELSARVEQADAARVKAEREKEEAEQAKLVQEAELKARIAELQQQIAAAQAKAQTDSVPAPAPEQKTEGRKGKVTK